MVRLLLIKTLFLLGTVGIAQAQADPVTTAKRAIQMLDNASTALSEAEKSSDRVAALTKTVRAYEEGLAALREGLRRATIRERAIALTFEAKRDRLSRLLGVLQTMGNAPAPLLLMHPSGALGTARSGMILSDVAPALQAEAQALRKQLEEIALIRALQESAEDTLTESLTGAQSARSALAQAIADRTDLPKNFVSDPAEMQSLIDSSATLEGFAEGLLSLTPPEIINPADFETAKGNLDLPVPGTKLYGFNAQDSTGVTRPGLTIATDALTLVTSPWPATLRYNGPLLDYGNVVILEPGRGYLLILAGLNQSYGEIGEVIEQGAPVGLMGGLPPNPDAFLISSGEGSGSSGRESLYIELRYNGAPIDPGEWFAALKE